MKRACKLHFSVPLTDRDEWYAVVKRLGGARDWIDPLNDRGRPFVTHTWMADDPDFVELLELLERRGIKWSETWETVYESDELRAFPFLCLTVERMPMSAYGLKYGTVFDLFCSCQRCGTGAIQTSPLIVPEKAVPRSGLLCQGAMGEILVAGALLSSLRLLVSGVEFRQLHEYRTDKELPWAQLISKLQMPRMHPKTRGIICSDTLPPCPVCSQDGHYGTTNEQMEICYGRAGLNLDDLPDIVHTWERFGKSGIDTNPQFSRYAPPLYLVKPNVFDIFHKLKVKHVRFRPVRFIE